MITSKKPIKPKAAMPTVEEFMRGLDHPLKPEINAVLMLIRGANPGITDGIKWNAPSFFYKEWFATIHLKNTDAVQIILHLGAKVREDITGRIDIDDPDNLLQWLGKDRASIKFSSMPDIGKNTRAFQAIVSQWLTCL